MINAKLSCFSSWWKWNGCSLRKIIIIIIINLASIYLSLLHSSLISIRWFVSFCDYDVIKWSSSSLCQAPIEIDWNWADPLRKSGPHKFASESIAACAKCICESKLGCNLVHWKKELIGSVVMFIHSSLFISEVFRVLVRTVAIGAN